MKKKLILILICVALSITVLSACSSGNSEVTGEETESINYPTKPVKVVIPYAPGGGSDILTRAIMEYIELPNDQPLVAVNVDGAAGMLGAMEVYNSDNDGYTILAHNPMDVVSYSMSGQTEILLWDELETISAVVDDFNVVSTNPQSGWTTIEEMVEYAKANPGEIKWGVTGAQTVNMADTVRVVEALGLTDYVTLVPYDGGAASRTALMGNHIQVETNSSSDIRNTVKSGDTIPLMVIGDRRAKALPDVPTTQEKDIDITTTKPRGYYAPSGTSQEILDILASAIEEVVANPEFIATVEELGLEPNFVDGKSNHEKVATWVEELTPVFEQISEE